MAAQCTCIQMHIKHSDIPIEDTCAASNKGECAVEFRQIHMVSDPCVVHDYIAIYNAKMIN